MIYAKDQLIKAVDCENNERNNKRPRNAVHTIADRHGLTEKI